LSDALNYAEIADRYVAGVQDGSILVCRTVRLTIERHVRDLAASVDPAYPFYFDPAAGTKVCKLFSILRPSKWPTPLELQPWQVAMVLLLYGWKRRTDHTRRFRIAFIMLPRKTGKSALLSGFCLNALMSDGERGAEVYSFALVEEQARRVFDEAVAMRDATPLLRKRTVKVGEQPCRRLKVPATNSEFRPLSRDKDAIQGTNPSFACGDEVHVWKGRGAWDDIRYGMEARQQPLLIGITTAPPSDDTTSIANTLLNYSYKVLEGVIPDDAFFPWITSLDPEVTDDDGNVIQEADRWDDETKWIKACPNLGVTVKLESMRQMALEAKASPESLSAFLRYSLNVRVDAVDQPIETKKWDACTRPGFEFEPRRAMLLRQETLKWMVKRPCFAALDLALTDDTSSLVLVFPPINPGEKWRLLPHFWIPEDNIKARVERDRVPYDLWRDQGFLYVTPGETTDYGWIKDRILELAKIVDMREFIYDPALASGLVKLLLQSGLKDDRVVKFAQTAMNYAAPCGDFSRSIIRREIEHDADPVLRWHVTNLRWRKNHTGLIMPDKEKSVEKIDGAVASIMGYGRGTHPDNAKLLKKAKVTVLNGDTNV
jgi:phage terminase large subunit-like protein